MNNSVRRVLLTFNNSENQQDDIKKILYSSDSIRYWCYSNEIGLESKLFHTHVFIILNSPRKFSTIQKMFPQKPHIDVCVGSSQENKDYVFKEGKYKDSVKEDTNIKDSHIEEGSFPVSTQCGVYDSLKLFVDNGCSNLDIINEMPSAMRVVKQLDLYRDLKVYELYKNSIRNLEVYYLFGAPASGKSSYVFENNEDVYFTSMGQFPFDEYKTQDVILFDDFRDSLYPIQSMLRLLDIYPLTLPARYNNKIACYHKVYITSNISLNDLYSGVDGLTKQALLRRINHYYIFNDDTIELKDNTNEGFKTVGTINNTYSRKFRSLYE